MGRYGVRHGWRLLVLELLSSHGRDKGWNLVLLEAARARDWRRRNNVDLGERDEIGDVLRQRGLDKRGGSKRSGGQK